MSLTPWNLEPLDVGLRILFLLPAEWWVIERADHDGREWYERTEMGNCRRHSKFLDHANGIEGPTEQLPTLICAIKTWQADDCKRWAIEPDGDTALVWSPRNSAKSTRVTRRALEAMVAEYEARAGGGE